MTDIDKIRAIRAEVERLFNEIKESKKECDSGAFYCLKNVLNFIDALPQEPISRDLEEAAADYAYRHPTCALAKKTFIEGAKWLANQGVSWNDKMTYYDGFLLYGKDEREFTMESNFDEGDKVIVQIRKKEE